LESSATPERRTVKAQLPASDGVTSTS
jgi:hypothetical protein